MTDTLAVLEANCNCCNMSDNGINIQFVGKGLVMTLNNVPNEDYDRI